MDIIFSLILALWTIIFTTPQGSEESRYSSGHYFIAFLRLIVCSINMFVFFDFYTIEEFACWQ